MQNIEDIPSRVDHERYYSAIGVADFIAAHHDEEGTYNVNEHWGPEGEIYRAICVWVLLDAYKFSDKPEYLDKSRIILERFRKRQRPSGGWTLSLGSDGLKFKVTDDERRDTETLEDPVISGAVLKSIADYQLITGTKDFQDMGNKAFDYLMDLWNSDIGTINEYRDRHLSALRSNPDSYHFMILLGLNAWSDAGSSKAKEVLPQNIDFARKTFDNFDDKTMPLMVGYYVAVLTKFCSLEYSKRYIKPKLDAYMKSGLFGSNDIPGGYGHHDGLRGIVTDELHMRSGIGLANAMKSYDLNTGQNEYMKTKWYLDICTWIDSMKSNDGSYFEYQTTIDEKKYGKGSAGQYLPILWILGTLLK
ncbi:MAG: hypothetical protein HOK52_09100 [Candidatus Marinimicrobia bacterium]|jgi:hypothetical protein|nr:hypothetical protein [Candidatus Scalindua sp.]MBT6471401.1 hypothetical protein [Candidatus Neomarinimicrobiota bacterium]